MANNGGIPQPLMGLIVNNAAWISNPEIQRVLLGNPRLAGASLERVLRAIRRSDLERIAHSNHYRAPVRGAAKKILGR